MAYRILCFDGGGVRGLLTATLLKRLDAEPSIQGWRARTDMLGGTSTGGLLALGLGLGKTPDDIIGFYRDNAPKIFSTSLLREVKDLGSLLGAKYDNKLLLQAVRRLLGASTRLKDLKPAVVVTSFDLDGSWDYDDGTGKKQQVDTWKPKIFHNDTTDPNGDDGGELVCDVAMRTSAAPTYFPTYGSFIDGGVAANNPSMVALAQALVDRRGNAPLRGLGDISLLSLGTGMRSSNASGKNHDWGDAEWLKAGIVDLLMDGPMDIARYQCRQLLGPRYWRLSPFLNGNHPLDDASDEALAELQQIADGMDLTLAVKWIKDNWM